MGVYSSDLRSGILFVLKNTIFMSISTFSRLLSGVVLFVVLARMLGLEDFGKLMYCFSLATLMTLLVDYGFTNKLLKEISATPEKVKRIMGRALMVKAFLTFILVLFYILLSQFSFIDPSEQALLEMMLIATLLVSFGDFINVAFRSVGLFHEETKVVIVASLIHFLVVIVIVFSGGGVVDVALGFVFSRLIYFLLCWWAYQRILGGFLFPKKRRWAYIYKTLNVGKLYALDVWLVNSIQHLDTILINYYLGNSAVGLYQAGMNIVRGLEQLGQVLANVYIPALAKGKLNVVSFKLLACKLHLLLLVPGLFFLFVLGFGSQYIPSLIYGEQFSELSSLLPYLGLFLLLRYIAVSQGVLLVVSNLQRVRVWGLLAGLFVMLVISPYFLSAIGLLGMVITQLSIVALLTLYYTSMLLYKKIPTGMTYMSLFIGGLGLSVFLLFIIAI